MRNDPTSPDSTNIRLSENIGIGGAAVFVDHSSYFTQVALMRYLTLDETLLDKTSFGRLENDGGVTIKSC